MKKGKSHFKIPKMKHIIFTLLLILIGCKDNTKKETKAEEQAVTENGFDNSVHEMWKNYIESNPEFKDDEIPESDFFHNNREDANRLAELTLTGKKKASSGLFSLYQQYKVDLPKVGTKQIITDFDGKAKAIIQITKVDTVPFNQISADYAEMDMGTNIEPLKKWKKAHWDFFAKVMRENGDQPTEERLVVCERFKTIWPKGL